MARRKNIATSLLWVLAIVIPLSYQVVSMTVTDPRVDSKLAALQKQLETNLPEEDFAGQFLELVTSDTIWTDLDGKITSATPTAARMFGYTVAEMKDMPITALMPEEYRTRHEAGFTAKMTSQKPVDWSQVLETTCSGLRKDKSTFRVEIRTRLKDTSVGRVGMSRFTEIRKIVNVSP